MTGITLSYVLGRTAGSHVLHRYGHMMGLTEDRLKIVHQWFESYGKWTLTFGYFIPGIRHFTGFAAGTSELEYPKFALFAYLGAAIWATVFLSIGYFFGDYWYHLIEIVEESIDYTFLLILAALGLLFFIWKKLSKK
jgi:membrane protein DedA with SNARE-associated domain